MNSTPPSRTEDVVCWLPGLFDFPAPCRQSGGEPVDDLTEVVGKTADGRHVIGYMPTDLARTVALATGWRQVRDRLSPSAGGLSAAGLPAPGTRQGRSGGFDSDSKARADRVIHCAPGTKESSDI